MSTERSQAARNRAYYGLKGRLEKKGAIEDQRAAERLKGDEQRKAESIKAAEKRLENARKQTAQRRLERRSAEMKTQFKERGQDPKIKAANENARQEAQKIRAQDERAKARERTLAQFKKTAEDKKKANVVNLDRVRQQQRKEEARKRAEAFVTERQKRQQADQQAEHRRQTDRMRTQHRETMESHKRNERGAVALHWQQMKNIDAAECRELIALDQQRSSLKGRVVGIVRGAGHYDRQEQAIAERHEADRMRRHRDLEGLKDRQFAAAQKTRLQQAHERKSILDLHYAERVQLVRAQERDRPRQIEANQRAFDRALQQLAQERKLDREQSHSIERKH